MKVSTERLENCQMALTIEVDEERAERALREGAVGYIIKPFHIAELRDCVRAALSFEGGDW